MEAPAANGARRPVPREQEDDPSPSPEVEEGQNRQAATPVGNAYDDRKREVTSDDRRSPDHGRRSLSHGGKWHSLRLTGNAEEMPDWGGNLSVGTAPQLDADAQWPGSPRASPPDPSSVPMMVVERPSDQAPERVASATFLARPTLAGLTFSSHAFGSLMTSSRYPSASLGTADENVRGLLPGV